MYRELSKIQEISDCSSKRWSEDCQVEPVITLRARCLHPLEDQVSAPEIGGNVSLHLALTAGKGDHLGSRFVRWMETTCYSSIISRCLLQIRPVNPWEGNRGNYDAGLHHVDKYALDYREILM